MEGMLEDAVKSIISCLSEDERFIIQYHVMSNQPITLEMLAEKLCMSRDETRLLVIAARDKMRELLIGMIEPGQPIPDRSKFVTVFKPGNA